MSHGGGGLWSPVADDAFNNFAQNPVDRESELFAADYGNGQVVYYGHIPGDQASVESESVEAEERASVESESVEAEQKANNFFLRPSAFICYALTIMVVLQGLTGWPLPFGLSGVPESWQRNGSPPDAEQGDRFADGSAAFTELAAALQLAPPAAWRGEAAVAYTDANETLMELAQQTADADQQTRAAVKCQADTVKETQFLLGLQQDFLIAMFATILALEQTYGTAVFTWLWWFAFTVAGLAVVAGLTELTLCSQQSHANANTANNVDYEAVTKSAQQVTAAYQPAPTESPSTAAPTRFTYFADVLRSSSAHSANSGPTTG